MKIKATKRNADAILRRLGTNSKEIKVMGANLIFYLYGDKETHTASVCCLAQDPRFDRKERFEGVEQMQNMLALLEPADKNTACQAVADLVASALDLCIAESNTFFCKLDKTEISEVDRWVPIGGAVIVISITDQDDDDNTDQDDEITDQDQSNG